MQQRADVSPRPSAAYNPHLLHCFSGTKPKYLTSGLCSMQFRRTVAPGHYISCHMSSIRYETCLILHLGDAHSDHPTDLLAFSVVVYLVVRSNVYKVPIPSLLRTIARDATYYFLVIFTSHLALVMFIAFGSVRILS